MKRSTGETDGHGAVALAGPDDLRRLKLRRPSGEITDETVLLLDDLAALVRGGAVHPDTLIQLDLKVGADVIDDATVAAFAQVLMGVAPHFILSGGDREAVGRLGRATADLNLGFDPCNDGDGGGDRGRCRSRYFRWGCAVGFAGGEASSISIIARCWPPTGAAST